MATRPVFFPTEKGPHLVRERHFDFRWSSGFAEVQKKKNVRALHDAAHREGIDDLLEIMDQALFPGRIPVSPHHGIPVRRYRKQDALYLPRGAGLKTGPFRLFLGI